MPVIHPASSKSWGPSACARLCDIIVESNHGFLHQVLENKADLLDVYSAEELEEPDDIGVTLPFLAVYYDQPNILEYLRYRRGIDLNKYCDPMNFGTPMFYAINLKRERLISLLDFLGCYVTEPCDKFKQTPLDYARKLQIKSIELIIQRCATRPIRAAQLFRKNYLKLRERKKFSKFCAALLLIQKVFRGILTRMRMDKMFPKRHKRRHRKTKRRDSNSSQASADPSETSDVSDVDKSNIDMSSIVKHNYINGHDKKMVDDEDEEMDNFPDEILNSSVENENPIQTISNWNMNNLNTESVDESLGISSSEAADIIVLTKGSEEQKNNDIE